jgi:4-aminobutyrate aminotransferase-like enzyme
MQPRVVTEIPGPESRALFERDQVHLAPGIQKVALLSRLAFSHGEGALLHDVDGNTFLDFFAMMGVASLGHGHPALVEALGGQAARLVAGSFASAARARLTERICAATRGLGLDRVQLYSGGAEAVESALRLARCVTRRPAFIGFQGAFHGKTGGVVGLCGAAFTAGLGPALPDQHLAPYPETAGEAAPCLRALEALAEQIGDRLAAIVVEPMQGTAGNLIPPPAFLPAVAELARRRGALLIADEMITGWGRTGRLFAVEHSDVQPDILTFGKGVAAGFPLSGLCTASRLLRDADPWTRPSFSSSSYGGAPLGAAAADAVTRVIVEERLDRHAAEVGTTLLGALAPLARHPIVDAVRGQGLLLAIDLVDPITHRPLDEARCHRLFHACLERGLLLPAYTPRVRINPPLVLTRDQALAGAALLDAALAEVSAA